MLDNDFIKRKLALNQKELERLQAFENIVIDEIAHDPGKHAACERYLERLIGRAIDINQHIISERAGIETLPLRYRDTFLALADLGVYTREFAEAIAPSAGLRNALVHKYDTIDPILLGKSVSEAIKEYNEYARYILSYIEKDATKVSNIASS